MGYMVRPQDREDVTLPLWTPSEEYKQLLIDLAQDWCRFNAYKLKPAHPGDLEIRVDLYFKSSGVEESLIFDSATRKLIRIEYEYFNLREIQQHTIIL